MVIWRSSFRSVDLGIYLEIYLVIYLEIDLGSDRDRPDGDGNGEDRGGRYDRPRSRQEQKIASGYLDFGAEEVVAGR